MSSDIIWLVIGALFGFVYGVSRTRTQMPRDLEICTVEKTKQEEDLAYYKKLTTTLVEENQELRRQINEA